MIRRRIVEADRKLGRMWSRVGGFVFLGIGVLASASLVESKGFKVATHWPGLAICAVFFLASIACFRSRRGLMDTLSDNTPNRQD